MPALKKEVICDVCGRLFWETRRRHYCEHCHKFYYVCEDCRVTRNKCRLCGIPLKKKSEPEKAARR